MANTQIERQDLLLLFVYLSRVLVGSSDHLTQSIREAQEYNKQAMEHWQQANMLKSQYELHVSGVFNTDVRCQAIWDDLDSLKKKGLLDLVRSADGNLDCYKVTAKGEEKAKNIEQSLPETVQRHFWSIVQSRMRNERTDRL